MNIIRTWKAANLAIILVLAMLACDFSTFLAVQPAGTPFSPVGEMAPDSEKTPRSAPSTPVVAHGEGRVLADLLEVRQGPSEVYQSSDAYWRKGDTIEITGCAWDKHGTLWVSYQMASVERWSAATYDGKVLIEQAACQ